MKQQSLTIDSIPAILWGEGVEGLFIAVHGDQSNKEDRVIAIFAQMAAQNGFRTLSFDLPRHGDRKADPRLCNPPNCAEELEHILAYASGLSEHISLFACSIGAYFSMMAYKDAAIQRAFFLSPLVNMRRMIENMMLWFEVSKDRLEQEKEVATPMKTLYWDDYQYALNHPVRWDKPTAILYGEKDELCEYEYLQHFATVTQAELTVMPGSGHFFHTQEQLNFYRQWLKEQL